MHLLASVGLFLSVAIRTKLFYSVVCWHMLIYSINSFTHVSCCILSHNCFVVCSQTVVSHSPIVPSYLFSVCDPDGSHSYTCLPSVISFVVAPGRHQMVLFSIVL